MGMTLTEFINERSEILTSTRDRNPLFYLFVAAKLKAGSNTVDLQTDYILKQVFSKAEWLSNKLGKENVKILSNNWPPAIILIKLEEYTNRKPESVVKKVLQDMQRYLMGLSNEFSKSYEIENNFKEFINSKEVEDYFVSIRK